MNLKEITEQPTVLNNTHESCYRIYHILNQVLEMMDRGDSKESINEVVDYLKGSDEQKFEIDVRK